MKKLITLLITTILSISTIAHAGILDTSFNIGSGANGLVEQVLPLSNGKILICGNFTSFNGKNRAYVARLNSDGSVDESFTANPGYWVRNMAVQGDGKIVIGGYFTTVTGVSRNLIARLNADGSLDTSFNPGTGAQNAIAAGIDGNVDPFVFWVAVQPDGKIIATGNFRNYNGAGSVGIVRINPDGSRDTSFNVGNGLDSWGRHIEVLSNGQILVAGWFTAYNGQGFNRLVKINPNGSPDTSFRPYFGDKTAIYSTRAVGNKFIVAGHSLNEQGLFRQEMARLNPDGSFDSSFVGYTNEKTESIAIQSDGKIIVGGNFTSVTGQPIRMVGRMNPDGSADTSFQANIDNFVWTVALQADGKALISGGFTSVDGVTMRGVARLLTGASGGGPTTPPPTDTPPSLSASAVSSSSINLSWSDSTSRTGYVIERRSGNSGHVAIAAVASTASTFSDAGLSPNTGYIYRVKANNSNGTSVYSNEASANTLGVPGNSNSSAQFAGSDSSTMGNWKGVYGGEGYQIIANATSLPGYVQVTPSGASEWIWQWSTGDADCLQKANAADRLAACWYSGSGFSATFNFTDGQKHLLAVYFHDWDNAGRSQVVRMQDADTGAVLDSQTVSAFGNGVYLKWTLGGKIRMTVTPNAGNAVLSGLFFGPAGTPQAGTVAAPTFSPGGGTYSSAQSVTISTATSGAEIRWTSNGTEPTATSALYSGPVTVSSSLTLKAKAFKSGLTASSTTSAVYTIGTGGGGGGTGAIAFVRADDATRGSWRGVYGTEGYAVLPNYSSYPGYVQANATGKQDWTWNATTTDSRGLQTPDGSNRTAGCWYSGGSMDINLNFTDGNTHRVALYFCDWDNGNRSQKVEVLDGSGAVGYTTTLSGFSGGRYLVLDLKGSVKVRVSRITGANAIINGIFFK